MVLRLAKSLPLFGSLKPWHQRILPFKICGKNSCFCSSVPHCNNVGPTRVSPKKSARIGAFAFANSSANTTPCNVDKPLPPYSTGHVAQIQPPSNNFVGHPSLNALRSADDISKPLSNQPFGRLALSHVCTSVLNVSASGVYSIMPLFCPLTSTPVQAHVTPTQYGVNRAVTIDS
ncbi:unannotated protein [freshwater metagenome]|uniref:Unannotated protein n=1 Tax=freshwater metagenome TaxID=449393 RepID=A0A6J6XRG0_9ZZZZ